MKIASLLTDFLYQNKSLNIPGLGRFFLDKEVVIPDREDKNFQEFLQLIQFENKPVRQADAALIDFIRAKTGKIKPLAEADLDTFISDCQQFINIGKPIYLEGIGTLISTKPGKLEFTPGVPKGTRMDAGGKKADKKPTRTTSPAEVIQKIREQGLSNRQKTLLTGSGIAAGIILLIWAGLLIMKGMTLQKQAREIVSKRETPAPLQPPPQEVITVDTPVKQAETVTVAPPPAASKTSKGYKFVLQETDKRHVAESNFKIALRSRPDLKMETRDSLHYKIYVMIECAPQDTSRQKIVLNNWYWGKKEMRVVIN